MQLETLQLFSQMAGARSISRGARLHHCSISTASHVLDDLERRFGLQLVERPRHPFHLTRAGLVFHEQCRDLIRLYDEARRRIEKNQTFRPDTFVLAACHCIALHHLPEILRRFRQTHPFTDIRVECGRIDHVHQLVRGNAVDLGLVAYARHRPGLAVVPFGSEPLVLICHPEHPLAPLRGVTAEMLKGRLLIAWSEIPYFHCVKPGNPADRRRLRPEHWVTELDGVKALVERDVGVALLPLATVTREVADGRLAAVPFENGAHTEPLAAIYRKCRKLTPIMLNFIEFLKRPEQTAA